MRNFNKFFNALLDYQKKFGDVIVPQSYIIDGYKLGKVVSYVRYNPDLVSTEERKELDLIGFAWNVHSKKHVRTSFEEVYNMLKAYLEEYGNADVPLRYVTCDGCRLGAIVNSIRTGNRYLDEEQKERLNKLGFSWKSSRITDFLEVYNMLIEYKAEHGNLNFSQAYVHPNGRCLGKIAERFRYGKRKLSKKQFEMLNEIGFPWISAHPRYSFDEVYDMIVSYRHKFENCKIKYNYIAENGVRLGLIAYRIRVGTRKITDEQREMLNSIGFE